MLDQTWLEVLEDVPDDTLQAAARDFLKSEAKWRPAPGEIRTNALKLIEHRRWEQIAEPLQLAQRIYTPDEIAAHVARLQADYAYFTAHDAVYQAGLLEMAAA